MVISLRTPTGTFHTNGGLFTNHPRCKYSSTPDFNVDERHFNIGETLHNKCFINSFIFTA